MVYANKVHSEGQDIPLLKLIYNSEWKDDNHFCEGLDFTLKPQDTHAHNRSSWQSVWDFIVSLNKISDCR